METLVKIQNELKVPKGNFNSFGKYKYRSAEDILEAVKPILKENKAVLILFDEVVSIGSKIFVKATAKLMVGNNFICETFGFAETSEHKGMSAEQTTGTASSYARKYALNGLFLIDETESDADSKAPEAKKEPVLTPEPKKYATMTDQQAIDILNACTTLDILKKTFLTLHPDLQVKMEKLKDKLKPQLTTKKATA